MRYLFGAPGLRTLAKANEARDRARHKLTAVASILSCSEDAALPLLCERALAGAPNEPSAAYLLPDIKVRKCERISDELVQIELENGRLFRGQRSEQKHYVLYQIFMPHLAAAITGDAYKLALDIQRRYFAVSLDWYCRNGGTFIEGGAFTGMKAIRWHDLSTKPLRIVAVEIGETNYELLKANIVDNRLAQAITPVHAGLWKESGEGVQKHSFTTRRFLETTDRWADHMRYTEPVRLLSLDDLLDEHRVEIADYVNIQVNGAEIQVLEGLKRAMPRVKVLGIAAYYSQDGRRNADLIRERLHQLGCTILQETPAGRITAVTKQHTDEILALRKPRERHRTTART